MHCAPLWSQVHALRSSVVPGVCTAHLCGPRCMHCAALRVRV